MAVLKVLQYGEDILRQKCIEVSKTELKSKQFKRFARDMLDTMYRLNGVGLAAPQVGVTKRIITIDVNWPEDNQQPLIIINPKIVYSEGELLSEEGCLSFRGSREKNKEGVTLSKVKRFRKVKVNYLNLNNEKCSIEADGDLLSRCLQHEIDHLDGVLFIDREDDIHEVTEQLKKAGFECPQP